MGNQIKVALPLAAAILLIAVFLVWLDDFRPDPQADGKDPIAEVPRDAAVAKPPSLPPPPPPPKVDVASREDFGGNFPRWNLKELPEGWNPKLAGELHQLFIDLEYGDMNDPTALAAADRARTRLLELLASLGPEDLPTLETVLNADPDFLARRYVFDAIGKMGPRSEKATYILSDFYHSRVGDPRNRPEVGNLIKAMGHLKNNSSFGALSRLSQHSDHRPYREKFIVALGDHPRRAEAIDIFHRGMTEDPNFQTRNKSAQAYGKVADPETLGDLYQAFEKERIFYAQQTILGSIGKIGEPDSIPFLEDHARASDKSGVRLSAASAIRRIVEKTGDRQGRRALQELARDEPDAKIREHISKWLSDL